MDALVATSPKKSDKYSKAPPAPAPPRVAFGNITPDILNRASRYVDVVKFMKADNQAEVSDVCEAERYHFETTAAYCLQNGTGLQRSMLNSLRDNEFTTAVQSINEQLKGLKTQNDDLQKQNKDLKQHVEKLEQHVEKLEQQSKTQNQDLKQLVVKLEEQSNTQNKDLKQLSEKQGTKLESLEKHVGRICASLHNDRARKRNNGTYAQFLEEPAIYGKLSILPLLKEVQGQMNVTSLRERSETVRSLPEVPSIGSKYSEGPATWDDLFKVNHLDLLKMCQWYNDRMGIAKGHNLEQRRHAVAAWLSGRNFELETIASPAAAAAESRTSDSDSE
jgi:hypothetical protein